jgi:hypothetical protein
VQMQRDEAAAMMSATTCALAISGAAREHALWRWVGVWQMPMTHDSAPVFCASSCHTQPSGEGTASQLEVRCCSRILPPWQHPMGHAQDS